MLEVMQFIFSSFWVWFGTLLLIGAIGSIFGGFGRGCRCGCQRKEKA